MVCSLTYGFMYMHICVYKYGCVCVCVCVDDVPDFGGGDLDAERCVVVLCIHIYDLYACICI